MNCGKATVTVCLLQKLSGDGLCWYWDGLPLQCTTHVSAGFALTLVDLNTFGLFFFFKGCPNTC